MNYWYFILKWVLRIIFAVPLYINYRRDGQIDNEPKIFVANHPSTLDPLILMIVLPEQVAALITDTFSRSSTEQQKSTLFTLMLFPEMDILFLNPITGAMEILKASQRALIILLLIQLIF